MFFLFGMVCLIMAESAFVHPGPGHCHVPPRQGPRHSGIAQIVLQSEAGELQEDPGLSS